jgi:hypothetical protein
VTVERGSSDAEASGDAGHGRSSGTSDATPPGDCCVDISRPKVRPRSGLIRAEALRCVIGTFRTVRRIRVRPPNAAARDTTTKNSATAGDTPDLQKAVTDEGFWPAELVRQLDDHRWPSPPNRDVMEIRTACPVLPGSIKYGRPDGSVPRAAHRIGPQARSRHTGSLASPDDPRRTTTTRRRRLPSVSSHGLPRSPRSGETRSGLMKWALRLMAEGV